MGMLETKPEEQPLLIAEQSLQPLHFLATWVLDGLMPCQMCLVWR